MPNFSFFWQKHYGEIGNCCMTYPLKKLAWINPDNKESVPRKFEGKQLVIDFIDVNWMYAQKLKWIGWDIQGWLAWTDARGMLYRIKDLKRNEVGQEFEKEVNEVKCELSPMVHTGNPSAEELYRFERDTQRKCGFCPDGQRSGPADEQQEKLQETRKPPIVPAWEKFVSGDAIVEYGPAGKEIMPPHVNVTYPIAVTQLPQDPLVQETKKATIAKGFPEEKVKCMPDELSAKAISFLKSWESSPAGNGKPALKIYDAKDIYKKSGKKHIPDWTIGWGHKILSKEELQQYSNGITIAKAEEIFRNDLKTRAINIVHRNIHVCLTQNQFDALVCYVFNVHKIGPLLTKAINSSKNQTDLFNAAKHMDAVRSGNEILPGLVDRRQKERDIWQYNNYVNH
jgi:lysozyme